MLRARCPVGESGAGAAKASVGISEWHSSAMAFHIYVQVKGAREDVVSPDLDQQEAERQLQVIREAMKTAEIPELPWIAVTGRDIVDARIAEEFMPGIA